MAEVFRSVAHGDYSFAIVSSKRYRPGTTVQISMTPTIFTVDHLMTPDGKIGRGIRIEVFAKLGDTLLKRQALLTVPIAPGDPPEKAQDASRPFTFSTMVTVPWDGKIEVDFGVPWAEAYNGISSTLTATSGELVINPL